MRHMSNSPAPMALLIQGCVQGDERHFARLYDVSAPRVYGMVIRVVRDPALAEEVTQEIYLEVWRKAARFDASRSDGWGWLMAIAHRRAVDTVRSNQAARLRDSAYAHERERNAVPDPESSVIAEAERSQVRRCMGGLTALQRSAVHMAYWDGLTHTQIAHELGAALGTVKSRLRDGVRALARCLEHAGERHP